MHSNILKPFNDKGYRRHMLLKNTREDNEKRNMFKCRTAYLIHSTPVNSLLSPDRKTNAIFQISQMFPCMYDFLTNFSN
jgi:hypothetical protein